LADDADDDLSTLLVATSLADDADDDLSPLLDLEEYFFRNERRRSDCPPDERRRKDDLLGDLLRRADLFRPGVEAATAVVDGIISRFF